MVLLDPKLGGKLRAVIITLFSLLVIASETFEFASDDWFLLTSKIVGFVIIVIQVLTHFTPIGNDDANFPV